jgi:CMP-N-acetylneuraminic acid synthetase
MIRETTLVCALVPARGGSKGVHRKNLAHLRGRPLIAHTIEAALSSEFIDETWVSSEDEEILAVARGCGALPLKRPLEYATDTATADVVVRHFIEQMSAPRRDNDPLVVYLQPTSPLRTASHIDSAIRALQSAGGSVLMSVTECVKSPFKAFRLDDDRRLVSLFDERLSNASRQDLPTAYMPNGAIYMFKVSEFVRRGQFPSNGGVPFVMTAGESLDIDTPEDMVLAERLMGERHG